MIKSEMNSLNEAQARKDIVEIGRRLYANGYVASNDGNISVRLSQNEIIITPTGVSKGSMGEDDLLLVNLAGEVLTGALKPTSEMKMHLAVYRLRPDAMAVVHAHPQKATAFAVAGIPLERVTLPEAAVALGPVRLADYGTPSTEEVPQAVERSLGDSDALLLANHGALTLGRDVYDAYNKMEILEHFASISLYARLLGGERELPCEKAQALFRMREAARR